MFVACWSFDVKYGSRDQALGFLREQKAMVQAVGWKAKRTRVLNGSIGARESRFVIEHEFKNLAELEESWDLLHKNSDKFSGMVSQMKGIILDGSPRWEIYRVVDES